MFKLVALFLSLLEVSGARLDVRFEKGPLDLDQAEILDWIRVSARAVSNWYGRFPVAKLPVLVRPVDGSGVPFGHADDDGVLVLVGRHATRQQLAADWVLVHELTHLTLPTVPRQHHWLEEGMATYVEPLARALPPEKIWGDLVDGLPNGLPRPGDRGLDFTPTWGRTYWGGALFFLLADVEIHVRTRNQKGLRDALRGIVAAGGNMHEEWPIARVLAVGDGATGVPVLRELYEQMKASPHPVDLPDLWKRLGVVKEGGRVRFDDTAPLAAVRRAITSL